MNMYDDKDFDELILVHMIHDPKIYNKTKQLRFTGEDFLTSILAGNQIYQNIGEILLELNICPCPKQILEIEINQRIRDGVLTADSEKLQTIVDWFYDNPELSYAYVEAHLIPFLKHRRFTKVKHSTQDPSELYSQLAIADSTIPKTDGALIVNPFDMPILCETSQGISTGFSRLDIALGGGYHKEECGLILAASGSGKTSLGVNFCAGSMATHNVMYISLEEPMKHLVQRFYANRHKLPYTKLKNGDPEVQQQLIDLFQSRTDIERAMFNRLKVVDARDQCPITYKGIEELLENAANEGFVTDAVVIDQLDFMAPFKSRGKGVDKWQEYEQICSEIDTLSQYKIGGTNNISVWVLHQIHGKALWEYSFDNIAGYKGAVKPFDMAVAVGRYPGTDFLNIHSLKTRHGQPFAYTYTANFSHMTFNDGVWQPPRNQNGEVIYGNATFQKPKTDKVDKAVDTRKRIAVENIE